MSGTVNPEEFRSARFRALRLLNAYYELTLQLRERFGAHDPVDLTMLVLIALGDLGSVPMDAELLAEKLAASRSTVDRRLRPFLDQGVVVKEREGKGTVFKLGADILWNPEPPAGVAVDLTEEMVQTLMELIFDLINEE
ncbi:hypothetical protein GR183_15050 [Stappia sp. GBMRC 2046]|uniref:Uncharacterized protein n=1 Tax=Stappia sediminis TaxID=2692190 RepID=A0A7X3LWA0_9HYPH|nr:hypothetical protein [Stappia sediminis]MXN66231.1 hypothetical protein [Stappia sediminis]